MVPDDVPRLYVEGRTDEIVVMQVLRRPDFFVHANKDQISKENIPRIQLLVTFVESKTGSSGSRTELLADLGARLFRPTHRAVGYVIDADRREFTGDDLASTWQSIRDRLAKAPISITTPQVPPTDGFVGYHSQLGTPIGVWLMPDNTHDGTLEDFLKELASGPDQLLPYAERCTVEARKEHGAAFGEKDTDKAVICTWLAWQEEPGMNWATAFKQRCLNPESELGLRFSAWVQRLLAPRPE